MKIENFSDFSGYKDKIDYLFREEVEDLELIVISYINNIESAFYKDDFGLLKEYFTPSEIRNYKEKLSNISNLLSFIHFQANEKKDKITALRKELELLVDRYYSIQFSGQPKSIQNTIIINNSENINTGEIKSEGNVIFGNNSKVGINSKDT